jgi:hypothetical protein
VKSRPVILIDDAVDPMGRILQIEKKVEAFSVPTNGNIDNISCPIEYLG